MSSVNRLARDEMYCGGKADMMLLSSSELFTVSWHTSKMSTRTLSACNWTDRCSMREGVGC